MGQIFVAFSEYRNFIYLIVSIIVKFVLNYQHIFPSIFRFVRSKICKSISAYISYLVTFPLFGQHCASWNTIGKYSVSLVVRK